jgi:hypothetical protein
MFNDSQEDIQVIFRNGLISRQFLDQLAVTLDGLEDALDVCDEGTDGCIVFLVLLFG